MSFGAESEKSRRQFIGVLDHGSRTIHAAPTSFSICIGRDKPNLR
jgi:hypothetical protein